MKNYLLLLILLLLVQASPNEIRIQEHDLQSTDLDASNYNYRHLELENQELNGQLSSTPSSGSGSQHSPTPLFPTEILINSQRQNTQKNIHLTPLLNGGFIASWQSHGQDQGDSQYESGVYAQIFDSSGIPYQSEISLPEFIFGNQSAPKTAELSSGDFIAVWSNEHNSSISGRCFTKKGAPKTAEFTINTSPIAKNPSVIALPMSKEIIITYQAFSTHWDIYMRVSTFDCSTFTNETMVNTYTSNDQTSPYLASNDNDQFVIVWESNLQDSSGYGVYLRFYYESHYPTAPEIIVNSVTSGNQMSPRVQKFTGSFFIVTWQSYEEDGSGWGAYAAYVKTSILGAAVVATFRANGATYVTGNQISPVPTFKLKDYSSTIICWASDDVANNKNGIYFSIFNSVGNRLNSDPEYRISTYNSGIQTNPTIITLTTGEFIVAWEGYGLPDSYGIYAQKLSSNPSIRIDLNLVSQSSLNVLKTPGGSFACNSLNAGCSSNIRWYSSEYSSVIPASWMGCPTSGGACSNGTYAVYELDYFKLVSLDLIACDPILMNCSNSAYSLYNPVDYSLLPNSSIECSLSTKNCSNPDYILVSKNEIVCDIINRTCSNSSFVIHPAGFVSNETKTENCSNFVQNPSSTISNSTSQAPIKNIELLSNIVSKTLETPSVQKGVTNATSFLAYLIFILPLFWILVLCVRFISRNKIYLDSAGMWYNARTGRSLKSTSEIYNIFSAICFLFWIFYPLLTTNDRDELITAYENYFLSILYGAFEILFFKIPPFWLRRKLEAKLKLWEGISIMLLHKVIWYIPGSLIISYLTYVFSDTDCSYIEELEANIAFIITSFILSPVAESLADFLIKLTPIFIRTRGRFATIFILGNKEPKSYLLDYSRIPRKLREYNEILGRQNEKMRITSQWASINSKIEFEYQYNKAWSFEQIDQMIQNAINKPKSGRLIINILKESPLEIDCNQRNFKRPRKKSEKADITQPRLNE